MSSVGPTPDDTRTGTVGGRSPGGPADLPPTAPYGVRAGDDFPHVPGFRLVEVIGRGGMGVVYRAWQESVGRFVAVKVLAPWLAGDASALGRFRREVAILARCDHPNVVRVLASGRDAAQPWFAMELLEGRDFAAFGAELAAHDGRAPPGAHAFRRIAGIIRDAARALHHLHEMGVVHRDVKPANLMLAGPDERVVVMDLGIATMDDPALSAVGTQGFVGTLRYMAPEQLTRPADEIDRRADVRSLGAVLHELLTGRPFLEAGSDAEMLQQVLHGAPAAPRSVNPAVPLDLDLVARTAAAQDPEVRYPTARALADDLDAVLDGRPVAARPPTLAYVVRLAIRRHRALAAASAALLVLAVASLLGFAAQRQAALTRETGLRLDAEQARADLAGELDRTRGLALARASTEALGKGEVMQALLLAREAIALHDGPRSWQALRDAVQHPAHESAVLEGHSAALTAVRFSPDGSLVLTASRDATARLWDRTGGLVATIDVDGSPINDAAFQPDGELVALACDDGAVKLRDLSGRPVESLGLSPEPVDLVAFSPDGRLLAAFARTGTVHLVDRATGRVRDLTGHAPGHAPAGLAFSPDGRVLVTAGGDRVPRTWRLPEGRGAELHGHAGRINAIAVAPDSTRVATVAFDEVPQVWDLEGRVLARLVGHGTPDITAVTFAPDGTRIVTGGTDATVRLWSATGRQVGVLAELGSAPTTLRYSSDGEILLGAFRDGSLRLWTADGARIAVLRDLATRAEYVGYEDLVDARFAPDGRLVLTGSLDGTARLWSLGGSVAPRHAWQHAAYFPEHDLVVARVREGSIHLLDGGGNDLARLGRHDDEVLASAISADGAVIVTGSRDGIVNVAHRDGREPLVLSHPDAVLDVAVGPGGMTATAGRDGQARIRVGDRLVGSVRHDEGVRAVAFLGDVVLSASRDGTAALSRPDGTRIATLVGHEASVHKIVASPSGRLVATASLDETARLWSADGTPLATLRGHAGPVSSVAFSPDESRVVTASDDRTARTWSVDGTLLSVLRGHERGVVNAEFAPDGRRIVTACADGTARLWDAEGAPRSVLRGHRQSLWSARFTRDGRHVVTVAEDGTMRRWMVEEGDLLAASHGLLVRDFSPAEIGVHGHLLPDATLARARAAAR